jgi:hypothetical protein
VKPWTQFFDLQGRKDVPLSYSDNISLKNIELKCNVFYDVAISEFDRLSNFKFENLTIEANKVAIDKSMVKGFTLKNVRVNKVLVD